MHGACLALRTHFQIAFLERLQHRNVLRQHLGGELLQPGVAGKYCQMPQQCRADTLPLIVVDHKESDFCRAGLLDNISSAGHDRGVAGLFHDRHQGDMVHEIDIQKEVDLPV